MASPVIMPKQGQSVETCIITKWFKKKGEKVSVGDILLSYETDKAAFDLESPSEGTLLETFFGDGAEVPVLVNVAVIGLPGEDISSFKLSFKEADAAKNNLQQPATDGTATYISPSPAVNISDSRIRISPRAKKLAVAKGLNYNNLSGSGPNGRIIAADINNASSASPTASKPAGAEFSEQPLSNVRKLIARAMHSSLQSSAQLTHHMSADVRKLLEARKKNKDEVAKGNQKNDITLNDMICWCVIRALEKFPEANTHLLGESIRTFHRVHLGIAVDTTRGLMVPAVKNADKMTLPELSKELKQAADACRKGSINPELIQSTAASFTVSNLGNYGVEMFTPVINLPQACVLGVCTIINRPVDLGNSTFGFVPYIGLSLTYDHRAIDGGPATLFLREIKNQIENFSF